MTNKILEAYQNIDKVDEAGEDYSTPVNNLLDDTIKALQYQRKRKTPNMKTLKAISISFAHDLKNMSKSYHKSISEKKKDKCEVCGTLDNVSKCKKCGTLSCDACEKKGKCPDCGAKK